MAKIHGLIALAQAQNSLPGWATLAYGLLFLAVLYFFQPIIAIVALTFFCLVSEHYSRLMLLVLAAMLSMFLGILNLTKMPESDLAVYLQWLEYARELDLFEFMSFRQKDPGYLLFTYLLANLPWSSNGLFIFVSTMLPYGIVLVTLAKLGKWLDLPTHVIVGVLIFVAFFPALFNNSAHLMRQFLAGALVAWFYMEVSMKNRGRWWIMLLALSVHTTALFFLPLALAASIGKYSPEKALATALLMVFSILVLLQLAGAYLAAIPYLGDIIQRVLSGGYVEHAPLGPVPLLLLFGLFAFSLYKLYLGVWAAQLPIPRESCSLYVSVLLLSLFIGWAHFAGETMLATRFLLYACFLTGPIILLGFVEVPGQKVLSAVILVLMPLYFAHTIVNGVWTYREEGFWTSFASLLI